MRVEVEVDEALARAGAGPLSDDDALALAEHAGPSSGRLSALCAAAARRRDAAWGREVTFSPKVFLPLTNLCRNRCDYCSFRRAPGQAGEWTMTPAEVGETLDRGRHAGCAEALFCLGDQPEAAFADYRRTLAGFGHRSTVDYLCAASTEALARGLLPHTNAGVLDAEDMVRLRSCNVSLGLMLESNSPRLCQPGMPHHRAPDKRPARRLAMIEAAGALSIPFTSGILVGIGESARERAESLLALRALHRRHGHLQEIIVQGFRAAPGMVMAEADEPSAEDIAHAVALARLILDDEVSVQAPPNLSPAAIGMLLDAGVNDWGGLSPVTPDYINPRHPWPHLPGLARACAQAGFHLRPRLPIYPRYLTSADHHVSVSVSVSENRWLDPSLRPAVDAAAARLATFELFPRDAPAAAGTAHL